MENESSSENSFSLDIDSISETTNLNTSKCCQSIRIIHSANENDNFDANVMHDLKTMRRNNAKNLIVGHLNVNSLRNKFLSTKDLLADNIDLLLLSETKLDDSFPLSQFRIDGYRLFRKDRDRFGGGLCLFVNEDIPFREIECTFLHGSEYLSVESNLRKRKWLVIKVYKPP